MAVDSVGSTAPASTTSTTTSSSSSASPLSAGSMQDEFLQLLTVQLKNQDPLNPVDQTQMLSQLAQFSSLQQMQNLNQTMSTASTFTGLTESASLIGKSVTTLNSDGSAGPSGQVTSVVMKDGQPYLEIGSNSVAASQVATVSSGS